MAQKTDSAASDLISLSKHMDSETVATDSSEGEIEITRTDITDTTTAKQPVSLLDKLRCPTQSDLCRKRKVETLKPTAITKRH